MSPLPGLHLSAPAVLGPVAYGVAAGVRGAATVAGLVAGLPRRGVWQRPGRLHIEVRGVHGAGGERVARRVERALEGHPGVAWARVNAPSERAVVALTSPPPATGDLLALVERAEAEAEGVPATEDFDAWCPEPDHPGDGPPARRTVSVLAADTAGLAITVVTRLAPWLKLPAEVAAVTSALERHPRLRRLAGTAPDGTDRAETVLPLVGALAQGVATRGGGLALDLVQRVAQWREATAERRTWAEREPDLVRGPADAAADPIVVERPGPPPTDGAARYAERSMAVSAAVGAAAAPLLGPRKGLAVALAGVPKAHHGGREGFATTLGRALALRGVVAMDRGALRRLGQVDTVVLDEAALRTDRYEPVDLEPVGDVDEERTAERLFALFDPDDPLRPQRADGWTLAPLDGSRPGGPGRRAAEALRRRGSERELGLARDGRLQAVAGLAARTAPGGEAVAAAARRAGARVVVAGDAGHGFSFADAAVPAGGRLVASVRGLQADGAVVLLVSGNRRALGAADCGVGVHRPGEPPPWGAHLLVGSDLEAAGLIVDAVGAAAGVDRESAFLAAGGSGVGAVAATQAPARQACARGAAMGTAAGSVAFCLGHWRARQLLARPLAPPVVTVPWHLMPVPRVLERLGTGEDGLSPQEAAARAGSPAATGERTRPTTVPAAFVEELANPLTPVLAAGAALAAAVGSRTDAALVAAITGTSALVGGVQRVRTERALAELFERSAIGARVRRDGTERLVTAGDLVQGDVIVLRPEDVVPADCRVLRAEGLEVDESSLTGESLPVAKGPEPVVAPELSRRRSMLYEGTTVSAGRGLAVVVATGSATEVGRSLATARQAGPATGVEARLTSLTRTSLPVAAASAAAVVGAGFLHRRPLADTLSSAVNLAVASVPEGLPFLVNAAQLAAARRLADLGALVRNPRTIEALGRSDVLCFDKTGTLTEGELRLATVADTDGALPADALDTRRKAVLAAALRATPPARQSEPMAHQTDRAVLTGARRARVPVRQGAPRWQRTGSLPFEPSRAYHATAGRTSRGPLLSVKGAPENVLERCRYRRGPDAADTPLEESGTRELTARAEELAGAGRRVLAVAERALAPDEDLTDDAVRDLVFLGFLTLADPVRTSAAPATARLHRAGVQTVMLTGDHPATAEAIAATVGDAAERTVCTGPELDGLDDTELDALLPTVDVIARCSPRHKSRIVQAYQRMGRVVAMTGDGANDAAAIRLADVGIALGRRGTPAATAAADLVVSDDRLETIVAALLEGRAMWASVRAALAVLVGGNLGEVAFGVVTAAFTGGTPLNARQIMLVNLLTDLAPSLAIAAREPGEQAGERLLREGPHRSLGTALTGEMLLRGAVTACGAGAAWGAARLTGGRRRAGTVALAALVGTQLAQTLTTGGTDRKVLAAGVGSAAVLAAVIQTPGVSRFFGCTPLGPVAWGITLAAVASATALGLLAAPVLRHRTRAADHGAERDAEQDTEQGAGEGRPADGDRTAGTPPDGTPTAEGRERRGEGRGHGGAEGERPGPPEDGPGAGP
ncbi:cation-transporting P-type ATPase [Streptomyces pactum]|uniref:Cation-transporting P-type ATPase n=1 Tax=Streptomyces pactum TaxID=68249 RepID=A0ABS0NTY1_9ACTN|nr:cation-transporting P-type ATPase [Streptomyces pactum]MBH5338633.1 cation-transporting P-type ATPase [Streptomyces pactum]